MKESLKIIILGTSGGIPTVERNLPAIAIKKDREIILFDCAESTQRQMGKAKLSVSRISKIFVTHLHGDHIMGIPGILQTLSLLNRNKPLYLFGPNGLMDFITAIKKTVEFTLTFDIYVKEAAEGVVYETNDYYIECVKTRHTNSSFAYAFVEKDRPGKFHPNKALALRIPMGPLWKKLQQGETITLSEGRKIEPSEVADPPKPGRKIVYSGDTAPCESVKKISKNATLLIHESTYGDDLEEKAFETNHSSASQAAKIAEESSVQKLLLTHISQRYSNPKELLEQAQKIFQNTIIAEDLMEITLD
ncbi:MAG: ribonuclease Z [Candidatus Jordarchaeum sp.]|uniref:ribonuclease Z n=1 Tax=Candidatus Jordarchaeum sp. TaxID=2823881 RepID=UPI00404B826C